MQAFGSGDYPKAISSMEAILAKAGEGAQLETVYYTLGAAAFNAGDYPKAIDALEKYLQKYPKGAKRTEALFSLGMSAMQAKDFAKAITAFKALENDPDYGERALLSEATAAKESGNLDGAIQVAGWHLRAKEGWRESDRDAAQDSRAGDDARQCREAQCARH